MVMTLMMEADKLAIVFVVGVLGNALVILGFGRIGVSGLILELQMPGAWCLIYIALIDCCDMINLTEASL